jgi:ribosomal protein L12E/L44/L45/RPP1/RPP2
MDSLSATQKQEMATSLACLTLYDGAAEISGEQINALLTATGVTVEGFYPIIFANFLNAEKIAELINTPGGSGGGGGGGAAGGAGEEAAVEEEKEKVEEEEMDMSGGIDMFGGGEAGGGDY